MRIIMLHSCRASEDGFVLRLLLRGECYDLASELARRLIARGIAVEEKYLSKTEK
jgi:hypothetical protein